MSGDSTTIARPYAEATFDVAKARGALPAWSDALNTLAAIVADPQIAGRIGDPNVPRGELVELIFSVAGDALPGELKNLVRLLSANRRLPFVADIARLFDEMKTAEQGLRHILVRTAFPMSDDEQGALTTQLRRYFGSEVELSVEEDASLIGGVEVRADDIVIDGSIRGRLTQLANGLQA